jgi:hypothetical protein
MLSWIAAEIIVRPVNHSVVFLMATNVIFTSDIRRVVINLDMSPYEVISAIQNDVLVVQRQTNEFTSISGPRQIDILLKTLESRLNNFKQFLPKLDPRRGLINAGSIVLRTLFGTATIADLHALHETLVIIQHSQSSYTPFRDK